MQKSFRKKSKAYREAIGNVSASRKNESSSHKNPKLTERQFVTSADLMARIVFRQNSIAYREPQVAFAMLESPRAGNKKLTTVSVFPAQGARTETTYLYTEHLAETANRISHNR